MNKDLFIRLFRSIEGEQNDDIVKVASAIIDEERKKGHERLANTLQSILERNIHAHHSFRKELKTLLPPGTSIPTDKRNNIPLATLIDHDKLRHDMVLPSEIEQKIKRVEQEYAARERLANFGLKPRQKILFYGPPGCGKSMGAERVAWNIGLPFLKVRFEAIISSYFGESASNLKILFDSIKTFPCVLLLDEFDFIAKARNSQQDVGEMHRLVNILLNLLEDFESPGILIATTNLEGMLDKALFRRFDDIVEIPKPGLLEIARLLETTLSSIRIEDKINWSVVAKKMDGFSAALVVKVARDAAKMAVIKGEKQLSKKHFDLALEENQVYKH